jgi:1-aminocyclopropane-1-carboxylate deaminase/D-cysteine desulfhydrase-like pyridoxal-dependent ACC family enzyme
VTPASVSAAATGSAAAGQLLAGAGAMPRIRLAVLPTPLVPAPRLAEALGLRSLLVKRDDLTGFAFGGNKARLLEFLIAGAVADGAGMLLTGGAPGSNFCAATAAAARRAGLGCELVIAGQPGPSRSPALALARSWDATVRWTGTQDRDSVDALLPVAAAELTAQGRRPYLIPRGGATALGAVGYALAAAELHEQLGGRRDVTVVVPTGSGGTLAGLVAGHLLLGRPWTLAGCSASRPPQAAARQVQTLASQCLRLLGTNEEPGPGDITIADARGPGHGMPSLAGLAAAEEAMRTEGLMLDPVYTAKALALAPPGRDVVFWHTGGILDAVAKAQDTKAGERS